ncbi:MAG TPA: hypothetical protein VFS90_13085, partial [Pyrinomonadaceae bacterium]|nr:hypothetical protein [Pyrinomonadaceae bacterium]
AFETRPVKSARPAVSTQTVTQPATAPAKEPVIAGGKIDRQEIAAIVDRFLAGKRPEPAASPLPPPVPSESPSEAGSMYVAPAPKETPRANGGAAPPPSNNGAKAVDFVSEEDVRRAIQKGEKIYITARTIITPAARDMGEPAEVFAKV